MDVINETMNEMKKERLKPVVTNKASVKKKTEAQKILGNFVSTDFKTVRQHLIHDVLIPKVKDTIVDMFPNVLRDTMELLFYGESGRRTSKAVGAKINYAKSYIREENRRDHSQSKARPFDYDDIEFDYRKDAETVLMTLEESLSRFGYASVADLYDLAGITTDNFMAGKYGWKDLRNAYPVYNRGKWIIKFPRIVPLD